MLEAVRHPRRSFQALRLNRFSIDDASTKRAGVNAFQRVADLRQDGRTQLGLRDTEVDILGCGTRVAAVTDSSFAVMMNQRGIDLPARGQALFHLDQPLFVNRVIHGHVLVDPSMRQVGQSDCLKRDSTPEIQTSRRCAPVTIT